MADFLTSILGGAMKYMKGGIYKQLHTRSSGFKDPRPILTETMDGVSVNLGFYDIDITEYGEEGTNYKLIISYKEKRKDVIKLINSDIDALIDKINELNKNFHAKKQPLKIQVVDTSEEIPSIKNISSKKSKKKSSEKKECTDIIPYQRK